jgi:hypothetical protein
MQRMITSVRAELPSGIKANRLLGLALGCSSRTGRFRCRPSFRQRTLKGVGPTALRALHFRQRASDAALYAGNGRWRDESAMVSRRIGHHDYRTGERIMAMTQEEQSIVVGLSEIAGATSLAVKAMLLVLNENVPNFKISMQRELDEIVTLEPYGQACVDQARSWVDDLETVV